MRKNIVLLILMLLIFSLVGCSNEKPEPEVPEDNPSIDETPDTEEPEIPEQPQTPFNVEYDKLLYYGQIGKIKVESNIENDEISIDSFNEDIIKIIDGDNDMIAKAVGEGFAEILISNIYGDELVITIEVQIVEGFAPPIDSIKIGIKESGPYYIGETYHLECTTTPSLYTDNYRYIVTDNHEINQESGEIIFKRAGDITVSVFTEGKSKRDNIVVEVGFSPVKESYQILYIGNSLTYVSDIPSIISNMISSDGAYITYLQDTPGGSYLKDHKNAFDKYISEYKFTHVFLQGQSNEPTLYTNDNCDFLEAIRYYYPKINENGAKIVLYQTWKYSTYGYDMTEKLINGYNKAASISGGIVSRAGEAFRLYEETYGLTPSLYMDMNHQSEYGAYLSACVHYTTLTGKKASNNLYNYDKIPYAEQVKIRAIADTIAYGKN